MMRRIFRVVVTAGTLSGWSALAGSVGEVSVCAVEPMSGIRRTGAKPDDGDFAGPMRIVAAGGEYEPGSLMLMSGAGAKDVMVEVGELTPRDNFLL